MKMDNSVKMIQETRYRCCPRIDWIQTWSKLAKKTAEETPQCTCFYKVHFASGDIKEIPISDFDPTTLNRRVVISYDGRYVFSTNYHKGIKQIDIDTGKVLWKYPIKHMFALWATEKSLLCLHKDYCPELMRISLESKESVEKIRVEGGVDCTDTAWLHLM